jgi:hypothetical protein
MASRSFFVASFALRIASASSGVIASVIYLNVADLTSSSCKRRWGRLCYNTVQSEAYRGHVDEELPEGLLASPSVQVPEGVVDGASRNVNNTLLRTDPTDAAIDLSHGVKREVYAPPTIEVGGLPPSDPMPSPYRQTATRSPCPRSDSQLP